MSVRASSTALPADRPTEKLGLYYVDSTEVTSRIENDFHGPIDENGVPLNHFEGQGDFYNITTISQYALALHDLMVGTGETPELRRKLEAQLDVIVANAETQGPCTGFFVSRWNDSKYAELRAPWVSALTQGNAISALLRGYQWNGDTRLLDCATAAFTALELPMSEGGATMTDENGHFWLEEYPMNPPSHVLNGFIFALWGVLDYARATGNERAWEWWDAGCQTLRARLKDYDCGFWSVYDLSHRELATQYYQINIHVPQLEAMATLTGEECYSHYARRWRRFSANATNRVLWWIKLRVDARVRALKAKTK